MVSKELQGFLGVCGLAIVMGAGGVGLAHLQNPVPTKEELKVSMRTDAPEIMVSDPASRMGPEDKARLTDRTAITLPPDSVEVVHYLVLHDGEESRDNLGRSAVSYLATHHPKQVQGKELIDGALLVSLDDSGGAGVIMGGPDVEEQLWLKKLDHKSEAPMETHFEYTPDITVGGALFVGYEMATDQEFLEGYPILWQREGRGMYSVLYGLVFGFLGLLIGSLIAFVRGRREAQRSQPG